jgi:GNAT superfamily N-acetyltransferase
VITNRFIKKNEVKELQLLLHEAYKSDTQLGINFQAARVTLQQIDEHIENTATFVTEINHTTHSQFSKQGYATQLIDWVEKEYIQKQLKAPMVSLGTAVEHPWLKRFYTSVGYQPVEMVQKTPDHLTVYMVKVLNRKFDQLESEQLKKYLNKNKTKVRY